MHYLQRRVKTRHYLGVNPLPWGLITVHNQNKGKHWLNGGQSVGEQMKHTQQSTQSAVQQGQHPHADT